MARAGSHTAYPGHAAQCAPGHAVLCLAPALVLALALVACTEQPEALLAQARTQVAQGEHRTAVIQLKNVLQARPDLAEARFLLGSALLQAGDAAGAETELRRALAAKYARDAVLPVLARALLAQGKHRKLVDEFGSVHLVRASAQADLQLTLSRAYAQLDSGEPARAALEQALAAAPAYPQAQLEHARQLVLHNDFSNAQTVLDALIAIEPASLEAWKLKGDVFGLEQGRAAESEAAYRTALALKPDNADALAALVALLLRQQQTEAAGRELAQLQKLAPDSPRTLFLAAQLAYARKDLPGAQKQVGQLLRTAPDNASGLHLAGLIEMDLQQPRQAQAYLVHALELAPAAHPTRKLLTLAYLRQQKTEQALQTLAPGLREAPEDPDMTAIAGEAYLQSGDLARAQQYLGQSLRLQPGNAQVRTQLALVEMLREPGGKRLESLRRLAAQDSGTEADLMLVGALLQQRQFDAALQALDAMDHKKPGQAIAAYLRGMALLGQQDAAGARASFGQATQRQPNYFPAVRALAALDLVEKKPQDARRRLEALLKAEPRNVQALLGLAEVLAASGAPAPEVTAVLARAVAADPGSREAHLALVEAYLRNKDPVRALQAAQNAASALPDDNAVLDVLGRTQHAAGDSNQAITTYRKLADRNPQSPLPYWRIAEIQMASNDRTAAIQTLQKALSVQPNFVDAQKALGALYLSDKRLAEARALAQAMQKQNPALDGGYLLEAEVLRRGDDMKKAQAVLQAGLKRGASTPLAIALHTLLLASGQDAAAERFSGQWQQGHPGDAAFIFNLGDQALVRKDYATAEQHYLAVLQLNPDNVLALNNQAWVGGKLNRKEAIGYAERAVALAPGQPAFLDTLATLRTGQGEHQMALELENRALAIEPQNPLFRLNQVRILYRAGQKEAARRQLDELSDMGETFPAQDGVLALRHELNLP